MNGAPATEEDTMNHRFKKLAAGVALAIASTTVVAADRTVVLLQGLTGVLGFLGVPMTDGMKLAAVTLAAKFADWLNQVWNRDQVGKTPDAR